MSKRCTCRTLDGARACPARQLTSTRKKAHNLKRKAPAAPPRCRATGRVNGLAEVETSKRSSVRFHSHKWRVANTVGPGAARAAQRKHGVPHAIWMCSMAHRCADADRLVHDICATTRLACLRAWVREPVSGYDGNRMAMRSERTYGMACTVPMRPGEGNTFWPHVGAQEGHMRGALSAELTAAPATPTKPGSSEPTSYVLQFSHDQ